MRRRKPRVAWLPLTDAHDIGNSGDLTGTVYNAFLVPFTGSTGDTQSVEIPIVLDAQTSFSDPNSTLSDIESSGYRLRRIVGKIWVITDQSTAVGLPPDAPGTVLVTAAFIIRQTDQETGQSLAGLTRNAFINPALILETGAPWIWRRSWFLGNRWALNNVTLSGNVGFPNTPLNEWPQNNFSNYAGGNSDGPHVDQKTARIVGPNERLFLDVSATTLLEGDGAIVSNIAVFTDIRVLGSLRTTTGNRRNASR